MRLTADAARDTKAVPSHGSVAEILIYIKRLEKTFLDILFVDLALHLKSHLTLRPLCLVAEPRTHLA